MRVFSYSKHILIFALIIAIYFLYFFISNINYLIPHTFVELAGAVVAFTVFSIGWHTRKYAQNNFIICLSIGYFLVGLLTILHALTFSGMGVLPSAQSNIPTQFWIATRYVESITILVASIYINKKRIINSNLVFSVALVIGSFIIISIFSGHFPDSFVNDQLTPFKIISEYVIISILIITALIMLRNKKFFEEDTLNYILISITLTIISELCFTLYNDPFGFFNVLGHYFMIFSIFFVYRSFIKSTLTSPYKTLFNHISLYTDELELTNQELRIKDYAIASSLNAIMLVDLKGHITYVNNTFITLFGYEHEREIIGQPAISYFKVDLSTTEIKQILSHHENWIGDLEGIKKDGTLIEGYITAHFIYSNDERSEPICVMASFLDLTERKLFESELIKAKKEAEQANRAKSNFLANMSHEIRTPMNGIIGFLHLLKQSQLTDKQREYITNIQTSTDTLMTIINDILDVSKIESGKMELEHISFDLHQAINECYYIFIAQAKIKQLALKLNIHPNTPQFAKGDPTRLKQVLNNLISNAIKFTHEGSVVIEVKCVKDRKRNNQFDVSIKVTDSGIGMNEQGLNKIFIPFSQADTSSTRKYGGSGLGLTICKTIVEMMNGSIDVTSEVGNGSCFYFTVTLEHEEKVIQVNQIEEVKNELILNHHQNATILLVEDNEVNRVLFTHLLNLYHIKCDIAVDGQEAVDACQHKKYDIVFMDCQMPVLDGYEATKLIRQNEKGLFYTKIIAITAEAMKGDIERCLNAGMDDYLSKPVDINQLKYVLNKYLIKEVETKIS